MEAPVDFRHRQTKRNLPPRAFSAKVQQRPLLRQPLEAIPCLLAMRTFISASRPMAKTVVSAVKPGGQAMRPCPSGFLVCASSLGSSAQILHKSPRRVHLRSRVVCGVANTRNSYGYCCFLRLAAHPVPQRPLAAPFVQDPLAIGHWRLYIDNGGCPWRGDCSPAVGRGSHRGAAACRLPVQALCQITCRRLVWCIQRRPLRTR